MISIDKEYLRELGLKYTTVGQTPEGRSTAGTSLAAAQSLGFVLAKLKGNQLLEAELSALESEGHGKLLANPRLIATNHQPAYVEAGEEIPYQEKTSSGATNVAFKKAVLRLKVVPEVTPEQAILLHLNVNQDKLSSLTVNGVPAIHTQEMETQLLVADGETVVLGGILEQVTQESVHKIPFLGSLPLLGRLFQQRQTRRSQREFLIFITPRIVA